MAIVSCEEIKDGRSGSIDYQGRRKYVRVWRVLTDNDLDGPLNATATNEIPAVGVPYATEVESDSFARVVSIDPRQNDADARLWIVTVTYDSQIDGRAPNGGSGGAPGQSGAASPQNRIQNPLNEPVRWSSDVVRQTRSALYDKDLKDYVNSAGVPFNPAPELYKPLLQITAVKNYASFPASDQIAYFDKVNLGAWMGFPADTVKIDRVRVVEDYRNDMSFLSVTWEFLYDPDKWIPYRVLDRGFHRLVAGVLTPNLDDKKNLVEKLLDGAGNVTTTPTYLLFRNHDRISFAGIP